MPKTKIVITIESEEPDFPLSAAAGILEDIIGILEASDRDYSEQKDKLKRTEKRFTAFIKNTKGFPSYILNNVTVKLEAKP